MQRKTSHLKLFPDPLQLSEWREFWGHTDGEPQHQKARDGSERFLEDFYPALRLKGGFLALK